MSTMAETVTCVDPRKLYSHPPFEQQDKIDIPGHTGELKPRPDHGEQSYQGSGKLKGYRTLITGGDSGIGRAVAIAYAREGADVAISFLSEIKDAEETARWVEEAGQKVLLLPGDLRDESTCKAVIDKTLQEFGSLEVLVNNAAYQETHDSVEDVSSEVFERIFRTNIFAPFWLSKAALSRMTAGGSIINTASIQGFSPSANLLPYATTKSALLGFTKGLAPLAMEHGVRVNAVAPGPVWTPLIPSTMPEEKFKTFGSDTVFERPAQPAELAPLYVWLASQEASYVTAEVFSATGGKSPV
jgi:NAD(P)-dependent dehydrogenase (short-subunit alcohol dehydrogenase family)